MRLERSKVAAVPLLLVVVIVLAFFTTSTTVSALQLIKTAKNNNHRKKLTMKASQQAHHDALYRERPPDELGRFFTVQPVWQGTSYSYVRPTRREKIEGNVDSKNTASSGESWEKLVFPHCGSISLENHAERVAPDGKDGTGFTLWSAALAISTFLDSKFVTDATNTTDNATSANCSAAWRTSLELGAGLGLPSIVLARHGVQQVIATDKDQAVLDLLETNMRENLEEQLFDKEKDQRYPSVIIETLDWANPKEESLQTLAPDLIVASDVIWNATRSIWGDFMSLLCHLRENYHQQNKNQCKDPWVIMGYTQRRLDMTLEEEQQFFRLLGSFGMEARTITDAHYSDHWPLTVLMELRWKDHGSDAMAGIHNEPGGI